MQACLFRWWHDIPTYCQEVACYLSGNSLFMSLKWNLIWYLIMIEILRSYMLCSSLHYLHQVSSDLLLSICLYKSIILPIIAST